MTDTARTFELEHVLAVVKLHAALPPSFDGPTYEIVKFMTGDPLATEARITLAYFLCGHALKARRPELFEQVPPTEADAPQLTHWMSQLVDRHGKTIEVEPLSDEQQAIFQSTREVVRRRATLVLEEWA